MVLARTIDHGGGHVVAPPPNQHLILPVLVDGLLLIKSLQRAVVTLVELPCLRDGYPHAVGLLEDVPQRAYRSLLKRRECHVGQQSRVLDQPPGLDDLLVPPGGERHVDPAGEFVLEVPRRFAVTDEDESVLVGRLEGGKATSMRMPERTKTIRGTRRRERDEKGGIVAEEDRDTK